MSALANLPLCTHRYALFVSYIGTRYNGSQRLAARSVYGTQQTVQEAIEWSLENILPAKRCRLTGSSRTDKGVHALMNCFTMPLMSFEMPTEKLKRLVNENLARKHHSVIVNEVLLVPNDFHPRRAVESREYLYRIVVPKNMQTYVNLQRSYNPMDLLYLLPATDLYRCLPVHTFDYDKALEAVDLLSGEHDFRSFAFKIEHDDVDTVRNVDISVYPVADNSKSTMLSHNDDHMRSWSCDRYDMFEFHFKSRAFLHNQIRRLVGTILSYASYSRIDLDEIKRLLNEPAAESWRGDVILAQPWGLYLSKLNYNRQAFVGTKRVHEDSSETLVNDYTQ